MIKSVSACIFAGCVVYYYMESKNRKGGRIVPKFFYKLKNLSRSELIVKGICALTLLIYLYCVLDITLLDRTPGLHRHVLTPLWEVRTMVSSGDFSYWTGQIGGNLIMLFPLGFLLPILSDRFRSLGSALIIGFFFSFFIEFTQYYTGRGLFEADDLLHNTLGACAGCLVYMIISDRLTRNENDADY